MLACSLLSGLQGRVWGPSGRLFISTVMRGASQHLFPRSSGTSLGVSPAQNGEVLQGV